MSEARSVTAHFVRTWTLTATADPSGGGTVTGGGTYDDGTDVTVTATPNAGYRFVRWAGDCTGTGTCSVAMTATRSVTAHFVARYTLTTSVLTARRRDRLRRGRARRRDGRHGHGHAERGLPLRALGGGLHGHGNLFRDDERGPHRHGRLRAHLDAHGERLASWRRHGQRRRDARRRHAPPRHGHAQRRLPLRPLVGRLHGHGRLYRDDERGPLRHGPLRPHLRLDRERLARRGRDRQRRRDVRHGDERHGHGQPEHGLPLRPLVGRLHGLRRLLPRHERGPRRDGPLRRAPYAHHERLASWRRDRLRRRDVRRRDGSDGHGHGQSGLPLPGVVGGLSRYRGLHGHDERRPLRHRRLRRRSRLQPHRARPARRRGDGHGRGPVQRRDQRHGHGHGEQRLPLQPLDGRGLLRLGRLLRRHDAQPRRHRRLRRALHAHDDRLAIRRRHGYRRGHVRLRGRTSRLPPRPTPATPSSAGRGPARDRGRVP